MWLLFATQLTAIATAVPAVFAIVTAGSRVPGFRKQSREVHSKIGPRGQMCPSG